MTAVENRVCHSQFPSSGGVYATSCRARQGSTRVTQGAEGAGGKHRQEPLLWLPTEK